MHCVSSCASVAAGLKRWEAASGDVDRGSVARGSVVTQRSVISSTSEITGPLPLPCVGLLPKNEKKWRRSDAALGAHGRVRAREHADVWLGEAKKVDLAYGKDLTLTMSRKARQRLKVKISYKNPIPAPIKMGTPIGVATVTAPNLDPIQIPIIAERDIQRLGFLGRMYNALKFLLFGKG